MYRTATLPSNCFCGLPSLSVLDPARLVRKLAEVQQFRGVERDGVGIAHLVVRPLVLPVGRPSDRPCPCRWSPGTPPSSSSPARGTPRAITNITRSGVRKRVRPINACRPTGPPITCESAPARTSVAARQVAVVGAAHGRRPAAAATPMRAERRARRSVFDLGIPALGHGGGGGGCGPGPGTPGATGAPGAPTAFGSGAG